MSTHDSFTSPASVLNPYSYGSAPVSNFQTVYRKESAEMRRRRMEYYTKSLSDAESEGRWKDVILFTDLIASIVMEMRAEADQRAMGEAA